MPKPGPRPDPVANREAGRARRRKNIVIFLLLLIVVVMFYFMTLVRLGEPPSHRTKQDTTPPIERGPP